MAAEKSKNRGGRPRQKPIKDGEKVQIGVRVSPRIRKLLEETCSHSGRSLSQEVEFRIEVSFLREVQFAEVADGAMKLVDDMEKRLQKTREVLNNAKADIEKVTGKKVGWEVP